MASIVKAKLMFMKKVDQLNKMRSKVEKEKHAKNLQIEEVRAAMDLVANEKATLEKQNRLLEQQRLDIVRRAEESNLTLSDYDNSRKKVVIENAELLHSIEELENNNSVLAKLRQTLTSQLGEVNKIGDSEAKERAFLLGKYRLVSFYPGGCKILMCNMSGILSMRLT